MDRDEEKDLYIKAKLKDGHIPEKIDNLFNNSSKLVEDIEPPKKNKKQFIFKRIAAVAACAVIALGGGNIYASTQGYDNVFFMIKEWVAPLVDVQGKDEILSDRDITISYQPIQIIENISIIISKMQIKDNEAKIILSVKRNDIEKDDSLPLQYKVYNSKKKILCEQISNENGDSTTNISKEELILKKYSTEDTLLTLEIYTSEKELITTISIDLENKEITVLGQEEHIKKISEIELKEFLGKVSIRPEAKEAPSTDAGTCIDISNISYSNGYYTITYTYCFLGEKSLFDIDINNIDIYQNTVAIKLNEDEAESKFEVVSMEEPIIIQKSQTDNSTGDIGTALWPDFEGTFALKNTYNQGNEINPKEWSTWTDNNWLVFHVDGTFTDTLFSKIFTDSLTVGGTYKFKDDTVELTYSNDKTIILVGDKDNFTLTGKIDEYDVTIMAYSHHDLSKCDARFVGSWWLQYGIDWSTGGTKQLEYSDLYDEKIYGTMYGANLTLSQEGNLEYSIAGNKKVSRRSGTWENVLISNNKIKVTLDDETIIYIDYYEAYNNGEDCISFQSTNNSMYREYYYKSEENGSKVTCGDVNCDGKVNNDDVDYLMKHLTGYTEYVLTEQGKLNADTYKDNEINNKDLSVLSKYLNKTEGYETLPYTPKEGNKLLYGDVNCDGKVNNDDVDYLMKHVTGYTEYVLTEQGKLNADTYKDNEINNKDLSILTKYLNKIEGYEILPYTPKEGNQLLYGDVNCDGKVNNDDVYYLMKHLTGYTEYVLTEQGKLNADTYKDDKLNNKDLSVLRKYLNKTEGYETLPYAE